MAVDRSEPMKAAGVAVGQSSVLAREALLYRTSKPGKGGDLPGLTAAICAGTWAKLRAFGFRILRFDLRLRVGSTRPASV